MRGGTRHRGAGADEGQDEGAGQDGAGPGTLGEDLLYHDEAGAVVHATLRYRLPDGDKTFSQRGVVNGQTVYTLKDITTVLYRLPELLKADPAETVFVVEGEKDADNPISAGAVATTNPMGAGKWRDHYSRGSPAGTWWSWPTTTNPADDTRPRLLDRSEVWAASVKIVTLPTHDVSDFLADGGTLERLHELVELADLADEPEPGSVGSVGGSLKENILTLHCSTRRFRRFCRRFPEGKGSGNGPRAWFRRFCRRFRKGKGALGSRRPSQADYLGA